MNPLASIRNGFRRLFLSNYYEGARQKAGDPVVSLSTRTVKGELTPATRTVLVGKSDRWEQNNPLVNRLTDLFEAYTVGRGMVYHPASSDAAWNKKAKAEWDAWSRLPDISSRHSLGTLESLAARGWFIQGEAFIHLTKGATGIPRIELIDAKRIATPPKFASDESVVDGVKLDANGRPIAYFVGIERRDGTFSDFREINADFIVHVFEPSRPGQVRGLPFIYPAIRTLESLEKLQALEESAAAQAAKVAITRETATGEEDAEDLMRTGTVVQSSEDAERIRYYRESLGGEEVLLKHGDKLEQFRSDRPSVVTMDFWRMQKADVCAGVGIPYVLAYPESMQGTVYRGALDMASAWFQARHLVIADAFTRVYEYVIGVKKSSVLSGAPADYAAVKIHPPKSPNVDVGRNSQAILSEVAAGIKSPQSVIAADGRDWREVYQECADAQALAKELGINLAIGANPPTQAPAGQSAPGAPGAEEDGEDVKPDPFRKAA